MTQANAAKLALEDKERREREQLARLEEHGEAKERAQKLIQTTAGARGQVPTSTVVDEAAAQQANERVPQEELSNGGVLQQERTPDDDVWAASRARLAAKGQLHPTSDGGEGGQVSASLQQAMDRRAARRAERSDEEAELERARREMTKSPLDAFVPMPKARK